MLKELKPALWMVVWMTLLTGVFYPALVTGLAQLFFPHEASGSLLRSGEQIVGSSLIGQPFSDQQYFWGRPSATTPMPYNAASSGASNLGPLNPALAEAVQTRIAALKESDPSQMQPIPVDLVTSSASGLDPHISPDAALWQTPRVARARNLSVQEVLQLVQKHTEGRTFGILGEPRVNVLTLNLAMDRQIFKAHSNGD
ncbi:MAG: potassium-transporting ATPase subunit KdpC [Magnetococcales bacterium]|nr:potassium-transporting ATPase subunit KdpC [Magnetococcales bacterium]MBF0437821.1 potassium-transporting ATPase subunit KdpC [Magnetococcales bacterium]